MKNIKINTPLIKIQYYISWFGFIFGGGWIIVLFLYTYGKNTNFNQEIKRNVLNKTWQKFAFIQGSILGDLFIIVFVVSFLIG